MAASEIVRLNVGGVPYMTTRTTLLMQEDTFFTGLLSGNFDATRTEDGALFIDRSGALFAPVLEYMRTGVLAVPAGSSKGAVHEEMLFYGLASVEQPAKKHKGEDEGDTATHAYLERAFPGITEAIAQHRGVLCIHVEHYDTTLNVTIFQDAHKAYSLNANFRDFKSFAEKIRLWDGSLPDLMDYETLLLSGIISWALQCDYRILHLDQLGSAAQALTQDRTGRVWLYRA